MERTLREAFGLSRVVWLEKAEPPSEDYTGGHLDGIARFISERTVVVGEIVEHDDPVRLVFDDAARVIQGAGFSVTRMRIPVEPRGRREFQRGNYLNWYVANGVVLVGTFGRPEWDDAAIAIVRTFWPTREVVPIDVGELWEQGGGIHCVTQQQPAESAPPPC
jgi:agmatine deiminase